MSKYYIKVLPIDGHDVFIDNVILEGEKEELIQKMMDYDFFDSLGIHESFLFEKFELIDVDSVEFPHG